MAPGINSFCVDKFGQYDISVSGCHTYDSTSLRPSFSTGETAAITINAIKHKNGVRILSDIRNAFQIAVEQNGNANIYNVAEEPNKFNGQFAYRYDFDLRPNERILVTPESDVMLFGPDKSEILGAPDCVEVQYFNSTIVHIVKTKYFQTCLLSCLECIHFCGSERSHYQR